MTTRAVLRLVCLLSLLRNNNSAFSGSVVLPIASRNAEKVAFSGFQKFVAGRPHFLRPITPSSSEDGDCTTSCSIPAFGQDARIQLFAPEGEESLVINISDVKSEQDFGWLCTQLYDNRGTIFAGAGVDLSTLRQVVASFHNEKPPNPGIDANTWRNPDLVEKLIDSTALKGLETKGFAVVDSQWKITQEQNRMLSTYLTEKTNQQDDVRTDTVHFLRQEEASRCGLEQHYACLMSIAAYLNDHHIFRPSLHEPLSPATHSAPLTLPTEIQIAEYREDDFYKQHSDNSLRTDGIRNNFREYTCILYGNDHWTPDMGGALRLWPGNRDYPQIVPTQEDAFVDILPKNGRLLLFDSCLAHSVQRVATDRQPRRALTLWISRPNDSGVQGETYY